MSSLSLGPCGYTVLLSIISSHPSLKGITIHLSSGTSAEPGFSPHMSNSSTTADRRHAVSPVLYIVTPLCVDVSTRRGFDTGLIEGSGVVGGAVTVSDSSMCKGYVVKAEISVKFPSLAFPARIMSRVVEFLIGTREISLFMTDDRLEHPWR